MVNEGGRGNGFSRSVLQGDGRDALRRRRQRHERKYERNY